MNKVLVGNTHITAGGAEDVPEILSLLEKEGIEARGNPDVFVRVFRSFGIDDARELRERAALRPARGERRVFLIVAPDLNRESQNALLKTLEEPSANALFIFVLRSPETLLPTLRSRSQMLVLRSTKEREDVDAKEFLAASVQKRLDLLKPLLDKGEDDKRDFSAIVAFMSQVERRLEKQPEGLRALYRARKYVTDRGALVKPLLEQVALLLPRV